MRKYAKRFLGDENGIETIEFVALVAVAAVLIVVIVNIGKRMNKTAKKSSSKIDKSMDLLDSM